MTKIKMFNTEFKAMRGLVMLAILFELFITGIEATPNGRREKRQQETWQSEQTEMEEDDFPQVDFMEEQMEIEEYNLPPVIKELSVFSLQQQNTVITKEDATSFYREERKILKKVETFIENQSLHISSGQQLEMPENEEQTFALVYITFLTFWMSVNFRLCSFILLLHNEANNIKSACDEHFASMAFAFSVFKKILGSVEVEFNDVLQLDLEFVMNENELKQKKESANYDNNGLIWWTNVPTEDAKLYRTNFYNVSSFKRRYRFLNHSAQMTFEYLYEKVLNQQINYLDCCKLWAIFTRKIYGKSDEECTILMTSTLFTPNYEKRFQMWEYAAKEEFLIPTNTDDFERIQKVIKLIYVIRNVDYTFLHRGLPMKDEVII